MAAGSCPERWQRQELPAATVTGCADPGKLLHALSMHDGIRSWVLGSGCLENQDFHPFNCVISGAVHFNRDAVLQARPDTERMDQES